MTDIQSADKDAAAQVNDACDHLAEALQDLTRQCSQFALYLETPNQMREEALEAQMPTRGAALQATERIREYLTILTIYTNNLPENPLAGQDKA